MDNNILKSNCQELWNLDIDQVLWSVDRKGRLHEISKWNLLGRLVFAIRNLNGGMTKRVNDTVRETLASLNEQMQQDPTKLFYVTNRSSSWFERYTFDAVEAYSRHYPVTTLASRILASKRFKDELPIAIQAALVTRKESRYPRVASPLPFLRNEMVTNLSWNSTRVPENEGF